MPANREKIEKWSLAYHLLKYYVDCAFKCYYRVRFIEKERINLIEPLIFAPNHQNALMDALAVLCSWNWQPVFLARSDIFNGRLLVKALNFIKMLPVYRMRDGFSTLQQNDATFRQTMDVINNRNGLVILPEGSHLAKKRLRPLKKGIARIAFQAEEASGYNLGIKIVPVGLDYEDYKIIGSNLLVSFGKPVPVEPYLALYRENPALAYNALMNDIAEGLDSVMLNFKDEANHDEVLLLADIISFYQTGKPTRHSNAYNIFEKKKALITKLNKLWEDQLPIYFDLIEKTRKLKVLLHQNNLSHKNIEQLDANVFLTMVQSFFLFLTLPLFVYSFVNLALPISLSKYMGSRFKDRDFHASVRLVVGLVAFPLLFLLQTLGFCIVFGFNINAVIYFVSLVVSLAVVYRWRRIFYSCCVKLKVITLQLFKQQIFNELKNQLDGIVETYSFSSKSHSQ
ncbi:MAG: 1-acyl-sn-glycerol-3-phosphate acyltransferase [Bacteroidales bacterium]|nr:1-acyl-sn-glycerol-3-phosphate acyltransferase [Bacteroidales bacterium]